MQEAIKIKTAPSEEHEEPASALRTFARSLPPELQVALRSWLAKMVALESTKMSRTRKVREALTAPEVRGLAAAVASPIGHSIRKLAWSDRSWPARAALIAASTAAVTVGGEAAGLAAFGTAIAIPLWVLFGGGAAVAAMIVQELAEQASPDPSLPRLDDDGKPILEVVDGGLRSSGEGKRQE